MLRRGGVDLGLRMLLHDKVRFAITVSGVAFAVTLVLTQVGIFLGMLENASITIDRMPADIWVTSHNTPNVDFAMEFPEGYVHRVRSIPGVERADNLVVTFLKMSLPDGAQEGVIVYAFESFERWRFPWRVVEGDLGDLRRGRYIFMDDSAEKRFGRFAAGDYREIAGTRFKIIGRTREARSFTTTPMVFMSIEAARALNPTELAGRTNYIVVRLAPGADVEAVRSAIRRALPYNDVYTSAEWGARSRAYWVANTGIGLSMAVTVFLGCLVGVVVVAQTLHTSTMEHLKEFGTVKAIGGSNADIYRLLGRQALIAALAGFAIGVVPAFALQPAVAAAGLKLVVPGPFLLSVFGGTIALCLAAAALSFRKVAGIDPALVFRG